MVLASQEHEAGAPAQGMTLVPVTSHAQKADISFPTAQQVLNLAALKYLTTIDPTKPEDLNGFVCYLEKVRETLIVDTQSGSLIITVECGSLEMLDELWSDYCSGFLNEMAQLFLITEEVLNELGLIEVKLTTTILEEEYRACREHLLQHSGESRSLYLHVCCFSTCFSLKATKILSVFAEVFLLPASRHSSLVVGAKPSANEASLLMDFASAAKHESLSVGRLNLSITVDHFDDINVTQYQQFFVFFYLNSDKPPPYAIAEFSKYAKFHNNLLKTHGNMGCV